MATLRLTGRMALLRSTIRLLVRAPMLSISIVLMLGLGVGVVTTTFGVVHAALFRQPPFPGADRIALLYLQRNPQGERPRQERWSFPRFELLRQSQRSFQDIASYSPASVTISGEAGPEVIQIERISAAYFRVLGAAAARGRLFSDAEDDPANPTP